MRPKRTDTSDAAWAKRKILSMREQDVLAFGIAEILGHGQAGEAHPHPGSRWLVHLTEHERRFFDDAGSLHLEPEIVSFSSPLPHTGEYRETSVL